MLIESTLYVVPIPIIRFWQFHFPSHCSCLAASFHLFRHLILNLVISQNCCNSLLPFCFSFPYQKITCYQNNVSIIILWHHFFAKKFQCPLQLENLRAFTNLSSQFTLCSLLFLYFTSDSLNTLSPLSFLLF